MTASQKNQADKNQPPAPKKVRKGFLKSAFNTAGKVLLGSTLALGLCQDHTPPIFKSGTNTEHTVQVAPAAADSTKLTFIFNEATVLVIPHAQPLQTDNTRKGAATNWAEMMSRHAQAMQNPENVKKFNQWLSQLDSVKNFPLEKQALAVDALVDTEIKYQLDSVTYHKKEYWASPLEIIHAKKGDCEDFAILKYYALRYLGVPANQMYIEAAKTSNDPKTLYNHATLILKIAQPQQNRYVVLEDDDTVKGRLCDPAKLHYSAYAAMNENGVWMALPSIITPVIKPPELKPMSPINFNKRIKDNSHK